MEVEPPALAGSQALQTLSAKGKFHVTVQMMHKYSS